MNKIVMCLVLANSVCCGRDEDFSKASNYVTNMSLEGPDFNQPKIRQRYARLDNHDNTPPEQGEQPTGGHTYQQPNQLKVAPSKPRPPANEISQGGKDYHEDMMRRHNRTAAKWAVGTAAFVVGASILTLGAALIPALAITPLVLGGVAVGASVPGAVSAYNWLQATNHESVAVNIGRRLDSQPKSPVSVPVARNVGDRSHLARPQAAEEKKKAASESGKSDNDNS